MISSEEQRPVRLFDVGSDEERVGFLVEHARKNRVNGIVVGRSQLAGVTLVERECNRLVDLSKGEFAFVLDRDRFKLYSYPISPPIGFIVVAVADRLHWLRGLRFQAGALLSGVDDKETVDAIVVLLLASSGMDAEDGRFFRTMLRLRGLV